MNQNYIQAYAQLTTLNAYGNSDPTGTSYIINTNEQSITFILIDQVSSSSGYQGYAYQNQLTGEIVVVHEGSQSLNSVNHPGEIYKDWVITDIMGTANQKITEQFYDSNLFLNKVRNKHSGSEINQAGMSLGGTLCEMNGALAGNENIETYTYNSYGAGHMEIPLTHDGYTLSGNYSNINNFTYNNEKVSTFNPHFGNVYKSSYNATGFFKYHSIEAHANNNLIYDLVENEPYLSNLNIQDASITINYEDNTGCFSFTISIINDNFSKEGINNLLNLLNNNGFLGQDGLTGYISNNNELYTIKTGDTISDISNRFGVSQEELVEANPWLAERYSEDKSFALIRPDEQIIIPEGSIKGTDNSGMDKYLNDALNGNIHPDTIAPEGVTLPPSGQTENPVVEHYTSKLNMLSKDKLLNAA